MGLTNNFPGDGKATGGSCESERRDAAFTVPGVHAKGLESGTGREDVNTARGPTCTRSSRDGNVSGKSSLHAGRVSGMALAEQGSSSSLPLSVQNAIDGGFVPCSK